MRKATVRALTTKAAVSHGVELATMVSATAAEAVRTRRDPAMVARRRRRAAKRRVRVWTTGTVVGTAASAGVVAAMVFSVAFLVWSIVGLVRAAADLRARTRIVDALPAASPPRRAVAGAIRPEISRLDGYSDGLRQLMGMVGIVDDDPGVRELRDEILAAADATETRLRRQADELTAVLRAQRNAPPDVVAQLDATATLLTGRIREGVAGYGQLVSAASEAAAASRSLADRTAQPGITMPAGAVAPIAPPGALHPELEHPIDQLRSLAAGMRELTQG
jgi:hypothetical protein